MKKKLQVLSISLALASATSILHAEGNINAGKQKSASCTSCHGDDGNSMVATFPKLAQQHSSYLVKQLHAFKDGSRNDPMMSAMALALTDEDITDISAYYATQKISENALPVLDSDDDNEKPAGKKDVQALIAQGSDLYRNGDLKSEVSACIACHGPFGEGNKPASFPALKSQHADYLIKALTDFKSGARSNNPENIMYMIAKKMTDEEIKAVSYRISMMK
ncbi:MULTISPECIES: c-type cytochrome [Methylobacter]|jgi:cytochrome c553|uniref:Cytochrome c class I n=2 Tax=Methylobacter tundripaludum TaxID=173365 RepID=G3IWX9_METTV|nr:MULTISPECIES: c-type cytochrome [Methylobacter]EGW23334.1 cytochrome c class I [Methylobacter tundripaludum SV96]MDI1277387.1 c-type cytochrome [Methylobacter sp.]MDI1357953.1 c-type cytochrome [Methylobacter sp.]PPK78114.1 cytochrome c553 [Methylobacter tundripaludum]